MGTSCEDPMNITEYGREGTLEYFGLVGECVCSRDGLGPGGDVEPGVGLVVGGGADI